MTNRSKVWQIEAAALNHLEGRTPRMLFAQAWDEASITSCNSSPTMTARWIDNVVNARDREYRVLALPYDLPGESAGDGNARVIYTNAVGSTNAVFTEEEGTPAFCEDVVYRTFSTARGGASNAVVTEMISTSNGLPLVDFCCQEKQVNTLDSALDHDFVYAYGASPGAAIVTGLLEDLRAKFHRLRMGQNRLAFCFLGLASGNAYGTISTGVGGFCTTSPTYANMLDATVTTRTADSPGVMVPGYASGLGLSNSSGVQIYMLAAIGATSGDGILKVIGPDHVAGNDAEIVVDTTAPTWYASGPVQLNTESAEATDATTARNKLDFHFLAAEIGENPAALYVYALLGFTLQT
jgi:hypothetical protein